ncbi:MAG: hypothetical protein OXR73_38540 [Myxococcales bacterium]|nr:hypothetical protein [Myxococcales bacterium]
MQESPIPGFLASLQVLPPLVVYFRFNPDTLRDNKEARFSPERSQQSGNAPEQCYVGGGDRSISFSFALHPVAPHPSLEVPVIREGIAPELATLRSFMYPRSSAVDLHWLALQALGGRAVPNPPSCLFGFGPRALECRVTSLDIEETQFNAQLFPVRANVDITLTVIESEENVFYQLDRAQRVAFTGLHAARVGADVYEGLSTTTVSDVRRILLG